MSERTDRSDAKLRQIPIIGSLQRVVLESSKFEDNDPLTPPKKGKLLSNITMNIGVEDSLTSYIISVLVDVKGIEEETNKERFSASCKMVGYYDIQDPSGLTEDIVAQAAQARGELQIYPLVRSHMLLVSRATGFRLNLPAEPREPGTEAKLIKGLKMAAANLVPQKKRVTKKKK